MDRTSQLLGLFVRQQMRLDRLCPVCRTLRGKGRSAVIEPGLIKNLMVIVLATATGFAASGIISNLYRLLAQEPRSVRGHNGYCAVMVVAGPNVLFGKAASLLRQKNCSQGTFWFAACLTTYWSFLLGLFVLSVSLSL